MHKFCKNRKKKNEEKHGEVEVEYMLKNPYQISRQGSALQTICIYIQIKLV